jgi:hypothetical protein
MHCGETFTPRRSDAKYCSSECRGKAYYQKNQEKMQARVQDWIKAHPEKRKEMQARYDERQRKARAPLRYERICEGCGEEFIAARKDKRACSRKCKNKYHSRRVQRYARHGENWDEIFARLWNGKCYLCEDPLDEASYHTDHHHSCCPPGRSCEKCRRGFTCPNCNRLIGYAQDDPDRLRRIADNLEIANTLVRERLTDRTR